MKKIITLATILVCGLFSFVNAQMSVEELQQVIDATGAEWTAGETSVSRMSEEDFKNMLGLLPGIGDLSALPEETIIDTPVREERMEVPHTGIKNQGQCGSCYAFGAIASYEGWKLLSGQTTDCSEQDLMMLAKQHAPSGGCSGSYLDTTMNIMRNYGVCSESQCPYKAYESACPGGQKSHKISSWQRTTSIQTTKNALSNGPVYVGFAVYADFRNYQGGYYQHVSGSLLGYHAVAIVGYDEQGWKVKNSWGTGWGESGYFRIKYQSNCEFGTCFGGAYWVAGRAEGTEDNTNSRLEIEKEVEFPINPDGTININITKENPLWTLKVEVAFTILEPAGTYNGSFAIKSAGKADQTGEMKDVKTGQKYTLPRKYTIYEGQNTGILNAKYTGTPGVTKGRLLAKIKTDDVAAMEALNSVENGRVEIEKEVKFQIGADGTINVNKVFENPLWDMKVKVEFTILNPAGTYNATFTISKPGKSIQSGEVKNVQAGQKYLMPNTFNAWEGNNNIALKGTYTGSHNGTEGTLRIKLTTID
jgi:C1A family cysteine protease